MEVGLKPLHLYGSISVAIFETSVKQISADTVETCAVTLKRL